MPRDARPIRGGRFWQGLPVETWVVGCTVAAVESPSLRFALFPDPGNIFNMMRQVSVDAIVAYGELFTIITAGIDLSVGSVAGFTGVPSRCADSRH